MLDRLTVLPFDPRRRDIMATSVVLSGKVSALSILYFASMVNFSLLPTSRLLPALSATLKPSTWLLLVAHFQVSCAVCLW